MVAEAWDVTRALTELGLLMLTQRSLKQDLERLARLASELIPPASGASFALLVDGLPSTVAVSDHFALELDLAQYANDEGPCLQALNGDSVRVGLLALDEEFPHFAVRAADLRINSVLSMPVRVNDEMVGTLNIYGTTPDAFGDDDERVASVFAAEGGNALARSAVLHEAREIRNRLQAGYDERMIVSSAEGVLVALQQCSADQARELVRNAATSSGEAIVDVANRIIASVRQPVAAPSTGTEASNEGLPEKG